MTGTGNLSAETAEMSKPAEPSTFVIAIDDHRFLLPADPSDCFTAMRGRILSALNKENPTAQDLAILHGKAVLAPTTPTTASKPPVPILDDDEYDSDGACRSPHRNKRIRHGSPGAKTAYVRRADCKGEFASLDDARKSLRVELAVAASYWVDGLVMLGGRYADTALVVPGCVGCVGADAQCNVLHFGEREHSFSEKCGRCLGRGDMCSLLARGEAVVGPRGEILPGWVVDG